MYVHVCTTQSGSGIPTLQSPTLKKTHILSTLVFLHAATTHAVSLVIKIDKLW